MWNLICNERKDRIEVSAIVDAIYKLNYACKNTEKKL